MMKKQRITTRGIAIKNIRRKPMRSFILIVFLFLFSFALFFGTVISIGLRNGILGLSNRLGADVMAVPAGYDVHIDSILLTGEPNNFFLPKDTMDKLKEIEGIDKMTPQVYLATLKSSCCSYPVQIIGIDDETDFIIKPWLSEEMGRKLQDGEVVIGYRVQGMPGEELNFFRQPYQIAGRLNQTGMAFDTTVFMSRNTIAQLAKEAERIMQHPLSEDDSLVSTVMIKLKPGYDSVEVANEITHKFSKEGIFGVFSKKFVNQISSNLKVSSEYLFLIIVVFWILAVLVIALLFTLSFEERKKEFAVIRALGGTKGKIFAMILWEAFFIGSYASGIGVILGGLGIVIAGPGITERLTIPFLLPDLWVTMGLGAVSFLVGVLTAVFASLFSARKIAKKEIYQNLRENE